MGYTSYHENLEIEENEREPMKLANKPQSHAIALYGVSAEGHLLMEYRGSTTDKPPMSTMLKFGMCPQLIIEDSDHKFIQIKG